MKIISNILIYNLTLHQVFAYAKIYGVKSVALIYPQFENSFTPPMRVELGDSDEMVYLTVGCVDIKDADIQQSGMALRNMLFINSRIFGGDKS